MPRVAARPSPESRCCQLSEGVYAPFIGVAIVSGPMHFRERLKLLVPGVPSRVRGVEQQIVCDGAVLAGACMGGCSLPRNLISEGI